MKFACLFYIDEDIAKRLSPEEDAKLTDKTIEEDWRLRREGRLILSQPLQPQKAAVTSRGRGGRILTTDGPFAETKEQMGGFDIVDCKDLDEAIEVASKIPGARDGSIEVRPLWEM